ncbi:ribonuclease H-like protein [Westerdykella ornata]|uniref:Ribonuclease H-like protein n=1 Tax=Westerdykella ornata TaxID=318751 RepID=A0A6A6JV79_WESOR|nr:ribonuclease H-like protein [Westerdykella ornata]KAF2280003.1 ribonuclease H-like protein [Westerdykella ornata]
MGHHTLNSSKTNATKEDPQTTEVDNEEEQAQWPLTYQLRLPQGTTETKYWSHTLYRHAANNKPVQVLYSKTFAESELLARKFLNEPIVGFDMEWPANANKSKRLQENIGLIQVACEDKIGLFHLGLHEGETVEEIVAPSLRRIVESERIVKAGVAVYSADFARLKKYYHLKPQGAFELGHLHRLVVDGGREADHFPTKNVSLSDLVRMHLGFPLWKGWEVRTTDWSEELDWKQRRYAAADAYAGYMLYKCMDAKRAKMDPVPPLPVLAEEYAALGLGKGDKKSREPATEKRKATKARTSASAVAMDSTSRTLFNRLKHRRNEIAGAEKKASWLVAQNCVLERLTIQKPLDEASLMRIHGIGQKKLEQYGAIWLSEIRTFVGLKELSASEGDGNSGSQSEPGTVPEAVEQPTTPRRPSRRRRTAAEDEELERDAPDSSPAFGSPLRRPPSLHTGLSFGLESTQLDSDDLAKEDDRSSWEEGDSGVFISPCSKPASSAKRKRKRPESPHPTAASSLAAETGSAAPLSPRSRIVRNKLTSYSKMIASMLQPRPQEELVSAQTLELIARRRPQTMQELECIPGIERLAEGCRRVGKDLLAAIVKHSGAG